MASSTRSPTSRRSRPSCCWPTSRARERRLADAEQAARSGDAEARAEAELWQRVVDELEQGRPAPAEAGLLSSKPALVVANIGEGEELPPRSRARGALAVCARDEAELGELDPEEAAAMRAELGLEPARSRRSCARPTSCWG